MWLRAPAAPLRVSGGVERGAEARTAIGPGFGNMVIVLGATGWPVYSRVVSAETVKYRGRGFAQAAPALGSGSWRAVGSHVLPTLASTIIVMASLEVAHRIILESFLSFLRLGIQPRSPPGA